MPVRELELDLEAFEGPFDLLLALVLREELDLGEIDVAGVVLAFVEHLAERDELDLDACGEFLVLVAALLELKARALLAGDDPDLEDLDPAAAAEELARRLAEYRRIKEAAAWLAERLEAERGRFFRLGPAPLAPQPDRRPRAAGSRGAGRRAAGAGGRAAGRLARPSGAAVPAGRAVPRALPGAAPRRSRFDFDAEVEGMTRVEQAVAFLALLELRKGGEIELSQAAPFAPIRVRRNGAAKAERSERWNVRSA